MEAATLFSFVLVGMKYNGVTAKEVERYTKLVIVPEPDNPHDSNAIRVMGHESGGDTTTLGHMSRDSLPQAGDSLTLYAPKGAVHRVYSSHARSQGAVEVIIHVDHAKPVT